MDLTTTITLVDGVRIVVPESRRLMTTYVLLEQEDWFEDEIRFLRRLLQPGQRVIDIGANYGTYTLTMAMRVGPEGKVWAFEPSSRTASYLNESISLNHFNQVMLEKSAVSKASGTARLSLNINAELNALVHGNAAVGETESVPVFSLDELMGRHGWLDIDFMKIDAEGEEANILLGGKHFFDAASPLVQYEIKAGKDLHLELIRTFSDLGYDSYRLVPGLDLLVPFDDDERADGYLLNLFCCKPDRAGWLAKAGLLLPQPALQDASAGNNTGQEVDRLSEDPKYGWRQTLGMLPYGQYLFSAWEQTVARQLSGTVEKPLAYYEISRDRSLPPAVRFAALEAAFRAFTSLCGSQPGFLRLASLARVARDYGAREIAVNAAGQLCNQIIHRQKLDLGEPFLSPSRRFDALPSGEHVGNWLAASTFEELEILQAFSSYFSARSSLERLGIIQKLGFVGPEMQRRLELLKTVFAESAGT